jgi:hypothetical protein
MLFGPFQPQKPENRIFRRYVLDGHGYIFSRNVDIAAGRIKMPAVLVFGPRERPWRIRQVWASVVEKARNSTGKLSTAAVLRLRATKRCVRR